MKKPFDLHADYQPESFVFNKAYQGLAQDAIARYPQERQQSAVMPLLDLAQRQVAEEGAKATPVHGGWIPRAAMDHIAEVLDMPKVKVYEVASFYSMYRFEPVGKNHIKVCNSISCHLCGSAELTKILEQKLDIKVGETTPDKQFSLGYAECLAACTQAPALIVNDIDYHGDMTEEKVDLLLKQYAHEEQ